jgi:hypothetical protein
MIAYLFNKRLLLIFLVSFYSNCLLASEVSCFGVLHSDLTREHPLITPSDVIKVYTKDAAVTVTVPDGIQLTGKLLKSDLPVPAGFDVGRYGEYSAYKESLNLAFAPEDGIGRIFVIEREYAADPIWMRIKIANWKIALVGATELYKREPL